MTLTVSVRVLYEWKYVVKNFSFKSRILLGRFLTRSGDQAWDFAVPIVLLQLFPDQIRIAALYFFLVRLSNVVILPRLAALIDRLNRLSAARLGIYLQLIGVALGTAAIYLLSRLNNIEWSWGLAFPIAVYSGLIVGGILSNLGSTFMDVAIANDLVPASMSENELSHFNSRLRQIDLFTEVVSPVAAGFLLLLQSNLIGFFIIAIWNIISFFPEVNLIKSVLKDRPDLMKKAALPHNTRKTLIQKLTGGWRAFFREPVALVAVAYAFLWLSVLSPHGVLLTGFLKDGWNMPEWLIGVFRGAGAFFGLFATFAFPWAEKRWGLAVSTRNFILFQAIMVIIALGFFWWSYEIAQFGFLIFILLSRVGLYGFSLGEVQIRQVKISSSVRGEFNGFANALTGVATLGLYGAGTLLPSTDDFKYLVAGSVFFVICGVLTYLIWLKTEKR